MNNLWAPWRLEYVTDPRLKEGTAPCVFCSLQKEEMHPQSLVLYRGRECYVVMNRFPYNNGHLLICSARHTASIGELSAGAQGEVMRLADVSMRILGEALQADGFNCGLNCGRVSGAGITDHFHFHIVPRWTGDTNFLPVIGEVKCMPEYLEKTYEKLKGGFDQL